MENRGNYRRRHQPNSPNGHPLQRYMAKTKMCRWVITGACERNENCFFAHSEAELRECPNLLFTRPCAKMAEKGICADGNSCKFAHSSSELRDIKEDLPCNLDQYLENGDKLTPEGLRRCLAFSLGMAYKPCDLAGTAMAKPATSEQLSSCSTSDEEAVTNILESVISQEDETFTYKGTKGTQYPRPVQQRICRTSLYEESELFKSLPGHYSRVMGVEQNWGA